MSRRKRSRSGGRESATPASSRRYRQIRTALEPVNLLTADQLETVHLASMRILEEIGIEFMGEKARRLFRDAGADVDDDTGRVRIDRELVDRALASAPGQFSLTPRNPENRMHLGGKSCLHQLRRWPAQRARLRQRQAQRQF